MSARITTPLSDSLLTSPPYIKEIMSFTVTIAWLLCCPHYKTCISDAAPKFGEEKLFITSLRLTVATFCKYSFLSEKNVQCKTA